LQEGKRKEEIIEIEKKEARKEGRSERNNEGFNPLNAGLNPICYLLELLETHHILHVSRIKDKKKKKRK
jgi:hypothetical protein